MSTNMVLAGQDTSGVHTLAQLLGPPAAPKPYTKGEISMQRLFVRTIALTYGSRSRWDSLPARPWPNIR